MLGLGDIVIPGMFVSTALRYDLSRSAHKDPRKPYSQPYFTAAAAAYALGLATTMAVMHTFNAAQPALLYLRYALFMFLSVLRPSYSCAITVRLVYYPSSSQVWRAGNSKKHGNGPMKPSHQKAEKALNRPKSMLRFSRQQPARTLLYSPHQLQ